MLIFAAIIVAVSSSEHPSIEEFLSEPVPEYAEKLSGQALVDYVNNRQSFFRAKYSAGAESFFRARLMNEKYLMESGENRAEEQMNISDLDGPIPESFDAREKWPDCSSISFIRDQSSCGSGWAVSTAGVLGDRTCIQSRFAKKVHLSDADILACCGVKYEYDDGCDGGYTSRAFKYAIDSGVPTGGRFGEKNVCKPYMFYPCGEHKGQPFYGPCPEEHFETPTCRRTCRLTYNISYEEDKVYGKSFYYLPVNETDIMREIMTNGPVVASFIVYQDFYHYEGGVYVHTAGGLGGIQAVRIIGWGTEKGTPYWLIANSWNTDWGENGYFRMLRGKDHCFIEHEVTGVTMRIY